MALGLALQAIGLAWVALIATPNVGYGDLAVALTIAGIGTSCCFPTVANAVMGSVPLSEAGTASGTNSMLRELGGVFGVAVLASVFARHGVYTSQRTFVDGFTQALWIAVGFSGLGALAALLTGARPQLRHVLDRAPRVELVREPA
jgi:MFS family permease